MSINMSLYLNIAINNKESSATGLYSASRVVRVRSICPLLRCSEFSTLINRGQLHLRLLMLVVLLILRLLNPSFLYKPYSHLGTSTPTR